MLDLYRVLLQDESGADMAEYGLLLALIAVAAVTAIGLFSDAIIGKFDEARGVLEGAGGGGGGGGT